MLHIADKAAFQNSLTDLPLVTYQPGETVIVDGSKTGRLLILKKGNVAIVKDDTEIAKVADDEIVFMRSANFLELRYELRQVSAMA